MIALYISTDTQKGVAMTRETQIKNLIDKIIPLLDLSERIRLIGLLEGMIFFKDCEKEPCENAQELSCECPYQEKSRL